MQGDRVKVIDITEEDQNNTKINSIVTDIVARNQLDEDIEYLERQLKKLKKEREQVQEHALNTFIDYINEDYPYKGSLVQGDEVYDFYTNFRVVMNDKLKFCDYDDYYI